MEAVLVVGVDGVIGANVAATLSERHSVCGVASRHLPGFLSHGELLPFPSTESIQELVARYAPARIVYCNTVTDSCWTGKIPAAEEITTVSHWLAAASEQDCRFTFLSSDAVFTGPWMFHAENSQSRCPSVGAQTLRNLESLVLQARPDALVLRTHAYGWSPIYNVQFDNSWVEQVLATLMGDVVTPLDCLRHASPILATDLAIVLRKAWSAGLTGIYHVAGGERTSPLQFASGLAQHWGLGNPSRQSAGTLIAPAAGFGSGETSLQTRKIRRALGVTMPLLQEGLARLREQALNGYRDHLRGAIARRRAA